MTSSRFALPAAQGVQPGCDVFERRAVGGRDMIAGDSGFKSASKGLNVHSEGPPEATSDVRTRRSWTSSFDGKDFLNSLGKNCMLQIALNDSRRRPSARPLIRQRQAHVTGFECRAKSIY